MRIERVDENNFRKEIDLVTISKEILDKYSKVVNNYKLSFEENNFVLDYGLNKFFFKNIKKINYENIITDIQKDLIKNNHIVKFFEFFIDNKENVTNKQYAIEFYSNNLEVKLKIYGSNKFYVYLKSYILILQDHNKKN